MLDTLRCRANGVRGQPKGSTDTIHLRLIEKHVVDFLYDVIVLIDLFFASCYG